MRWLAPLFFACTHVCTAGRLLENPKLNLLFQNPSVTCCFAEGTHPSLDGFSVDRASFVYRLVGVGKAGLLDVARLIVPIRALGGRCRDLPRFSRGTWACCGSRMMEEWFGFRRVVEMRTLSEASRREWMSGEPFIAQDRQTRLSGARNIPAFLAGGKFKNPPNRVARTLKPLVGAFFLVFVIPSSLHPSGALERSSTTRGPIFQTG